MTEDELRAILEQHWEKNSVNHDFCGQCGVEAFWPCETYRLAKLALAGMRLAEAADGHECTGEDYADCDLVPALAEYEEATR